MAFSQLLHCVLMPTPLLRRSKDEARPMAPGKNNPEPSKIGLFNMSCFLVASSLGAKFEVFHFLRKLPNCSTLGDRFSPPALKTPPASCKSANTWRASPKFLAKSMSWCKAIFSKMYLQIKEDRSSNKSKTSTDIYFWWCWMPSDYTFSKRSSAKVCIIIYLLAFILSHPESPQSPQRPVTLSKIHAARPSHFEIPVGRFEHPVRVGNHDCSLMGHVFSGDAKIPLSLWYPVQIVQIK